MAGWCPDCKVATHVLEGRELEAAPHVLKYIYTQQLPADEGKVADGMLKMWMIKVADCWDVPSCVTACQRSLCLLSTSAFPINGMFALPSSFCLPSTMEPVMVAARTHLLQRFGNAVAVASSDHMLVRVAELPASGMLFLLQSDHLATDSEATVLLLLRAWQMRNRQVCTAETLAVLKTAVRYCHLPLAYLCTALPQMPELCTTQQQERALWLMAATRGKYNDEAWWGLGRSCPKNWFLRRRPTVIVDSESAGSFRIVLDVQGVQQRMAAAAAAGTTGGAEHFFSQVVIGHGSSEQHKQ
ncbi:MAG: hypothetical protein WDW38_000418 [Sanguina aurantia]